MSSSEFLAVSPVMSNGEESNIGFDSRDKSSYDISDDIIPKGAKQVKSADETDFVDSGSIVSKRITIAGGFLDFALFSANVEHMKFVIEAGEAMKHYDLLLTLLVLSLVLQILAGIFLFLSGFRKTNHITENQASTGSILNQITIGLVSIIAVVNVFITIFGDRGAAVETLMEQVRAECRRTTST